MFYEMLYWLLSKNLKFLFKSLLYTEEGKKFKIICTKKTLRPINLSLLRTTVFVLSTNVSWAIDVPSITDEFTLIDIVAFRFSVNNATCNITVLYIPQDLSAPDFKAFMESLEGMVAKLPNVLILGDDLRLTI